MENGERNNKLNTGLTSEQVRERVNAGQVNGDPDIMTKSYKRILRDNLFTLFNLVNVILLVCILISGSYKNAMFFLVVIWNFLIGTIQEIRAKKTIEKLSLLSAPKTYVLRDSTFREIDVSEIVQGDIVQLKSGNQICADAVVLEGTCQVNESLITGENDLILKQKGDHLISGSFLVSGHVMAETEHVGKDNYINQITQGAKYYKKPDSVIMRSVRSIVRTVAIFLLPLAGLLVWNNFFRLEQDFQTAMVKTVAAVSSMIPGGLVLLVSIVRAVSVVRLSVHHTLVQDLYCVENLARVDTLLLDKTGTITEGIMTVEDLVLLPDADQNYGYYDQEKIVGLLKTYMELTADDNATALAVKDHLDSFTEILPDKCISCDKNVISVPFSSERKWSMTGIPGKVLMFMGAPEILLKGSDREVLHKATGYTEQGKRVVLFAVSKSGSRKETDCSEADMQTLPTDIMPLVLLVLSDCIRKQAPDTFRFFEQEGVSIKVISGDSPATVSHVAQDAGLVHADRMTDASSLDSYEKIYDAVQKYTVFGRVSPDQKLQFVKALKEQGHVVAMTGDGVNDVLALKEADCSVAMQSGSDAARNIANIVLLDNDFSSLPLVLAEGRKSINNLQRSAGLYLTKTVYSFLFAVLFLLLSSIVYPFENIQITLIGAVTIGIPSFFLALEPRAERVRKHFLFNVFRIAVPTGIMEAAALLIMLSVMEKRLILSAAEFSCAASYLMMLMGIIAVFHLCGTMRLWKVLLVILLAAAAAGAALLFPGLFSFVVLSGAVWKIILITAGVFFLLHGLIFRILIPIYDKRSEKKGEK